MDVDVILVGVDGDWRLCGSVVVEVIIGRLVGTEVFVVVVTVGIINLGIVDVFDGIVEVCVDVGVWLYVDGVYGGVAMVVLSVCRWFDGIEWCDLLVVDFYKWFFLFFDCVVLFYWDLLVVRVVYI